MPRHFIAKSQDTAVKEPGLLPETSVDMSQGSARKMGLR